MKDYIKKHKILSIILLILFIILLILPFIVNFNSKESSTDYVNYYGMILTSVFSSIVTITIFYFTLNENRRQLEEERNHAKELAKEERKLNVKPFLSANWGEISFNKILDDMSNIIKSVDDKNIKEYIEHMEEKHHYYDHVIWLYTNHVPTIIVSELIKTNYITTNTLSYNINCRGDLWNLEKNCKFNLLTIKNVGMNNAININLTINSKNTLPEFYIKANDEINFLFVASTKIENMRINLEYTDLLGLTYYKQTCSIKKENNNIIFYNLSAPVEIKNN